MADEDEALTPEQEARIRVGVTIPEGMLPLMQRLVELGEEQRKLLDFLADTVSEIRGLVDR